MTTKPAKFNRVELGRLYRATTGSATSRGAIEWAAGVIEVSRRTVERWLAGDGHPSSAQLARLHLAADIAARARRIRASRESGRGLWSRLRAWLDRPTVEAAVDERIAQRAEAQTRANLAFPSELASVGGNEIMTAGYKRRDPSWIGLRLRDQ
jgi:hypothetical protein